MARGWNHKVKIKHLLTGDSDWESVQDSMNAVADALDADPMWFSAFPVSNFRNISKGDSTFGPGAYANALLDRLYDYADDRRIWIE